MTFVKFKQPVPSKSFNTLMDNILSDFPSLVHRHVDAPAFNQAVPVNIRETESGYQLEVFAPGFGKEDFLVNLDKNVLTITAEKKVEGEAKEEKFVRREFRLQPFKRSFILDKTLDDERIEAKHVNGVLTVNLLRKEEVKAPVKQVTIQ